VRWESRELLPQIPKTATINITASMTGLEVRDRIREAFKVHMFDGQLMQLAVIKNENAFPALYENWAETLNMLLEHPKAMFSCLFRLR
jgi:hypothetical protein